MASATDRANIVKLYIAYFGRAPEPAGLNFWMNQVDLGVSLAAIGNTFAALPEAQAKYSFLAFPQLGDKSAFITSVYQAVFNRAPDAAGLTFWSDRVTTSNAGQIVFEIIANAGAGDVDVVNNKVTVANLYTNKVVAGATYSSSDSITILSNVNATAASVTTATNTINALSTGVVGTTFTLTTAAETITGTANDDTINATAATTSPTFTASDTITGGAGNDTLNLTVDVLTANSIPATAVSGVETINVRNVSGNTQTIAAAANFTGATSINSTNSTSKLIITGLAAGAAAGKVGGAADLDFGYNTATSAATLNVSGGSTGGAIAITSTPAAVTINSTGGAANTVGTVALGSAATGLTVNATANLTTGNITGFTGTAAKITVTGAATAVALGTLENTTVATVDASGLTAGGLTATLNTNTAITVTGGAGNDVITTGSVLTTGSVAAGAGTDRLVIADSTHVASASLAGKYTGFEQVQIQNNVTQNLALLSGITSVRINQAGNATIVTGLTAAQAADVTIVGTGAGAVTIGVANASDVGQIDTVKLTFDDGAAAVNSLTLTSPTLTGVENLEITAVDNVVVSTLANAGSLTSVVLKGAATQSITTGAVATANAHIDGSAATGALTIDAGAFSTNGIKITGGSAADTITGSAQADVIIGGAGNDTIANRAAGAATAADVLTGGDGLDTFQLYGSAASGGTAVATAYAAASRISDFTVGTATTNTDVLALSATFGNYTGTSGFAAGIAVAAAGATAIQTVAQNASAAAYVAGTDFIKLTTGVAPAGTLQAAFNAAIGTATVTGLGASTDIFVSFYDTTNSRMVILVVDADAGTNTVLESGDTVNLVGTINMTATDYANFSANSLAIIA